MVISPHDVSLLQGPKNFLANLLSSNGQTSTATNAATEAVRTHTVLWAAGADASPLAALLARATGAPLDRAGRVTVQPDMSLPGRPEVFALGDMVNYPHQTGKPLPGVAQVAMQQGRYAGRLIHRRVTGQSAPRPFHYFDKGNMAVVGKGFAVLQSGKVHVSGLVAWLAWAAVHLEFVGQSSLRISVFLQWVWTYVTGQRGSRLIVNPHAAVNGDARSPSAPERQTVGAQWTEP